MEISEIADIKIKREKSAKPKVGLGKYQRNWQTFSLTDQERKAGRLKLPKSEMKAGILLPTLQK